MASGAQKKISDGLPYSTKELIIPCLRPLDDLIKEHPELEIDQQEVSKIRLREEDTDVANGTSDCHSTSDSHSSRTHPGRSIRPFRGQSVTKKNNVRCNGKTRNKDPLRSDIVPVRQACKTSESTFRSKNESAATAKPGTAGSLQALIAPRGKTKTTPKCFQNSIIDTQNMVDETIVYSLKEICQRANLVEIPFDARQICKDFRIILCDLDLRPPFKIDGSHSDLEEHASTLIE